MISLFRQRWILAVLSALILCGYTADLVECSHASESAAHAGEHQAGDAGCDCICHTGYLHQAQPIFENAAFFAVYAFPKIWGTFPPDAVPRGIDTPPQLA